MSADLLRRAASLMRDRAEAATAGPWIDPSDPEPHFGDFGWGVYGCPAGETEDSEQGRADAAYIAGMHPGVALAVADWLEAIADEGWSRSDYANPGGTLAAALAVARAYLGESA